MMFTLFLALVMAATPQPIMQGKATHYNPYEWAVTKAGRIPIQQNGQIHDITAFTAAVSRDRWDELAGATLRVCTPPWYDCAQKCIQVVVTDSGNADKFRKHGVVVDLSVAAFRALRPYGTKWDNDGVLQVEVWRAE